MYSPVGDSILPILLKDREALHVNTSAESDEIDFLGCVCMTNSDLTVMLEEKVDYPNIY